MKLLRMVCLLLLCATAHARSLDDTPFLRLETGMHSAQIWRVSVDPQARYVATVSEDKTARVWELETGRLLQTLRPPLGDGNEGKLYAVAFSPDGQEVAVGGFTGQDGSGDYRIYLFDRASGRMTRSIAGLPSTMNDLEYSRDGQFLAVAMFGGAGIRVYRRPDLTEVARDSDYGQRSMWLDFDASGRLVTSCYDGMVRLYSPSFQLLRKSALPGGRQPVTVRFSPDGRSIAVGFYDTTAVNVVSSTDLSLRYAADTQGIEGGNLMTLAWSTDGETLYGGGRYIIGDTIPLVSWSSAGQGASRRQNVSTNTLTDLRPLADGRVVYGAQDPVWGVLSSNGEKLREIHSNVVEHYLGNGVQLNWDSTQFSFLRKGQLVTFDLGMGRYLPSPMGLSPAKVTAQGFTVSNWRNNFSPKFNQQAIVLQNNEISRRLAIAEDEQHFLLGADWSLRYFDQQGVQLWKVATPSAAWGVNLSADGRFAVVTFGDGTIRWYRVSDGKEQLAFFPHVDGKRWVLWTPTGYYDASPDGESLIGWHLNRGDNQAADFFPASRFRERFYRPDVVKHVLQTADEAEAVRLANAATGRRTQTTALAQVLPPVVELRSAAELRTDAPAITLRYRTRQNSEAAQGLEPSSSNAEILAGIRSDAAVTGIRVRVNGQAVSAERGLSRVKTDEAQTLNIPVPVQDSEVQVFAENEHGVSTPMTVQVKRNSKPAVAATATGGFNIKPKLYVLAVGVAKYTHPDINPLELSAKDAKDFAAAMQQQTTLYREVEVKLLTDADATRDNIVDALEWLQKQVTQHDVGMLFIAGHGVNDATAGYYYLPVNADPSKLKRTGVSMADIRGTMSNLAGKAVFFIDTCHAGNVLGGGRRGVDDMTGVINELASAENGVVVFSSSTGRQYSLENPAWGNGAFTKAVIEGIKGGADYQKTGRITHKMLDLFVSERVKQLTNGKQSPVTQAPGGVPDFPIAAR